MIFDACQSAGLVGRAFKPGPVASRGLGKISYDKGMRVLAATQASDSAVGSGELLMGYLTYSLMRDGIEDRRADLDNNGTIRIQEWLTYALKRVPDLYREEQPDRPPAGQNNARFVSAKEKFWTQTPKLFDFALKAQDPVLMYSRTP
jgi:hypothetical protein